MEEVCVIKQIYICIMKITHLAQLTTQILFMHIRQAILKHDFMCLLKSGILYK